MRSSTMIFLLILNAIIFLYACENPTKKKSSLEVITLVEHLYGGTGGVTVGPDNFVYISDFGPWLGGVGNLSPPNKVYRMDSVGNFRIFAQGFYGASGSKFDDDGNFYQSNVRKGWVSKVTPEGQMDTSLITGMIAPVGIEFDDHGHIYIANCEAHKIIKIDLNSGTKSVFCSDSLLTCPNGLTRDDIGNFYTSNFFNGNLIKIDSAGNASLLAKIPGNNNGHVVFHQGFLYVVGRSAHQIFKVSLKGDLEIFAGTGNRGRTNGTRLSSSFSFPNDIDISLDGKYMYLNEIADTISDHRVLTPTSVRRILMD